MVNIEIVSSNNNSNSNSNNSNNMNNNNTFHVRDRVQLHDNRIGKIIGKKHFPNGTQRFLISIEGSMQTVYMLSSQLTKIHNHPNSNMNSINPGGGRRKRSRKTTKKRGRKHRLTRHR